jgi:rod shape determining protein RodA
VSLLSLVRKKNAKFNYVVLGVVVFLACIGFAMLYSAGNGTEPWMMKQLTRFVIGLVILYAVAFTNLDVWLRSAYGIYVVSLLLLILVEIMGYVGGLGAQRWIDLYVIKIQPSELMKIALLLVLARYFHYSQLQEKGQISSLLIPLTLIALPAALVMLQPDLGTAVLLVLSAVSIIFLAGIKMWKVWAVLGSVAASMPLMWMFLHDYQKERVWTFLDPERDPFGSGYNIIQSKIALGSGGLFGKGFMNGSQGQLDFLPEKQTDFIFSIFCEEFGFVGAMVLLLSYAILIGYGYLVAFQCRSGFGRYLSLGMTTLIFLYAFINTAMVTGLVPVVGKPLPLISYGGTSLLTFMFGLGLLFCVDIHRDEQLGRAR